jgi:NADPH:quinone reductase-like Zn-dependent oxidoreductase
MSKTYKAIQFDAYGGPEVLQLKTLPLPVPGAGEVLVKVRFAGVNPIDWKLRSGAYHEYMPLTFPAQPGLDVSGVIEAVGPGVTIWKKGQAVLGLARGSYAEFAIAQANDLIAKPDKLSFEAAASLPIGALTAWAMVEGAGVAAGHRVLVQGAAGGVGMFALQFAKLKGAHVVGSSSTGNLKFVKKLGAENALDYTLGPLPVKDLDIVIDTVGGAALDSSYGLLKKGGIVVTPVGQPSEEKAKAFGVTAKNIGRGPITLLAVIANLVAENKVVTEIQKVFALKVAVQAHELSQGGHGRGRILIKV